jgi:hypothetical protein
MKHIKSFEINSKDAFLNEEVINKDTKTALRLVSVKYDGKSMNAIAIGYGSGPYYMEKYFILEEIPYDYDNFENVEEIDPEILIKNK